MCKWDIVDCGGHSLCACSLVISNLHAALQKLSFGKLKRCLLVPKKHLISIVVELFMVLEGSVLTVYFCTKQSPLVIHYLCRRE